jgi:hypothetical protein
MAHQATSRDRSKIGPFRAYRSRRGRLNFLPICCDCLYLLPEKSRGLRAKGAGARNYHACHVATATHYLCYKCILRVGPPI